MVLGLWEGLESVVALVREYVRGEALGQGISTKQALDLLGYVDTAVNAGIYFEDAVLSNFIDTSSQIYCIDCSGIKTREDFAAPEYFRRHCLNMQVLLLRLICFQAENPVEVLELVQDREYAPLR